MLHGLNSSVGQGAHIAHAFAQHGIETVGFDHRGFGKSEGTPGYVHNMEYHKSDCLAFAHLINDMHPELPLFCLGLSMGGLSAYLLTLTHSHLFEGAIIMAPAFKSHFGWKSALCIRMLAAILPEKTRLIRSFAGRSERNPTIAICNQENPDIFKGRSCLSTINFLM